MRACRTIGIHLLAAMVAALVISMSPAALAQEAPKPPAEEPAGGLKTDDAVLAGPTVEQEADAQSDQMMGGGGSGGAQRRQAREVPFQQWMTALRGLGLTQEQQTKVRAIAGEFEQAQRDYQASLSEEDREALRQAREGRQAGNPPPADIRQTIQKVEAGRPKPSAFQERIWSELTQEQQTQMKARLDELRQRAAERRGNRGAQRQRDAAQTTGSADPMDDMYQGRRRPTRKPADALPASEPGVRESADRAAPAPNRPGRRTAIQLDDRAQRRLNFLRSKQSPSAREPGREPNEQELRFEFEEDDRPRE